MALRNVKPASYPAILRDALNNRRTVIITRVGENALGQPRFVDRDGNVLKSTQASAQILEVDEEEQAAADIDPAYAAEQRDRAEESARLAQSQGDGLFGVQVFDASGALVGFARVRNIDAAADGTRLFESADGTIRYIQPAGRKQGVEKL